MEERRSVVVETILKPLLSKQNSTARSDQDIEELPNFNSSLKRDRDKLVQKSLLDFRDKKLPQSLIVFAQVINLQYLLLYC